jgi:hypothetical protein
MQRRQLGSRTPGFARDAKRAAALALDALAPALSDNGCFDAAAVQSTLAVMHEVEITDTAGDPAEGVLWTNEYNEC